MNTKRMVPIRALPCGLMMVLGAIKIAGGLPEGAVPDSLLRFFEWPPAWYGVAIGECLVGAALLVTDRPLLWRLCLTGLFLSVGVHAHDLIVRGANATGCGCFGNERQVAGVDLIRACATFSLFLIAYRAPRRSPGVAWTLSSVGLLAFFVWSPALAVVFDHRVVDHPPRTITSEPSTTKPPVADTAPRLSIPLITGGEAKEAMPDVDRPALDLVIVFEGYEWDDVEFQLQIGDDRFGLDDFQWTTDGARATARAVIDPEATEVQASASWRGQSRAITVTAPFPAEIELIPPRQRAVWIGSVTLRSVGGEPVIGESVGLVALPSPVLDPDSDHAEEPAALKAKTDANGIARFVDLVEEATYRVELPPGFSVPLQAGGRTRLDASRPSIELVIASAGFIWLRAVDRVTGESVAAVRWSLPHKRDRSYELATRAPGDLEVWRFGAKPAAGDKFEVLVRTRGSNATDGAHPKTYATYGARAPGYDDVSVEARLVPLERAASAAPQTISLTPIEVLGTLTIVRPSPLKPKLLRLRVESVSNPRRYKVLFAHAESPVRMSLRLPVDEYRVLVQYEQVGESVQVMKDSETVVTLPDSHWRLVRFRVLVDDKPYSKPVAITIADPNRHQLYVGAEDRLQDGRSEVFAVRPSGKHMVVVYLDDGRQALVEFESEPSTAEVEVRFR